MIKSKQPEDLRDLKKQITPPEGVCRWKHCQNYEEELANEGMELYKDDGNDLEEKEVNSDQDSENDEPTSNMPPIDMEVLEVPESPLSDKNLLTNSFSRLKILKVGAATPCYHAFWK